MESCKNSTAPADSPQSLPLTFTASLKIYGVRPDAKASDLHDHLSARLSQLSAMLMMSYGAGFESFSNYNHTIQENYLWACSSLAVECEDLLYAVDQKRRSETATT